MGMSLTLLTAITIFTGVMVSFGIKKRVKEYYISLLALVTGVFGVFMSLDLFFYYFFYELAVIPMFLLIGIWGSTTVTVDQNYATMKLVLQLSTGAVIALVGLIWIYGQVGTFDMVLIESHEFAKSAQMVWFPVVFLGFATLVPMWPLHSWSPAGHAAAPAAVSMLHAGVLMKLGAFSIIRFCFGFFPEATSFYMPIVAVLCCMNIVYGGLVAVHQKDLKLMIGYSSSSHMGYVLLGMASLTILGLDGAVFLMFAHGLMTALLFSLVGLLLRPDAHAHEGRPRRPDPGDALRRDLLRLRRHGVRRPPGLRELHLRDDGDLRLVRKRLEREVVLLPPAARSRGVGSGHHRRVPAARGQGRLVRRHARALERG